VRVYKVTFTRSQAFRPSGENQGEFWSFSVGTSREEPIFFRSHLRRSRGFDVLLRCGSPKKYLFLSAWFWWNLIFICAHTAQRSQDPKVSSIWWKEWRRVEARFCCFSLDTSPENPIFFCYRLRRSRAVYVLQCFMRTSRPIHGRECGHWFLRNANHQPRRNGERGACPRHFVDENSKWRGAKLESCSKWCIY